MQGHTDYKAWLVREKVKYLQFVPTDVLRLTPVINRVLLKIFTGPNELVALCSK